MLRRKNQTITRYFTPYEKSQLYRYGVSKEKAQQSGQMPVEYITGHVEFLGLDLLIDQRALIPRVETEELVTHLIMWLKQQNKDLKPKILEVGTGSGAITLSLAQQLSQLAISYQLVATDISPDALNLAKTNASRLLNHQQLKQITFVQSDLYENISTCHPFTFIIANLPYIPQSRMTALDVSVKDYEPRVALSGGKDGFQLIKQLLNQADQYLVNQGVLLLEIDYTQPQLLRQNFANKYQIDTWTSQLSRATFAQLRLN